MPRKVLEILISVYCPAFIAALQFSNGRVSCTNNGPSV